MEASAPPPSPPPAPPAPPTAPAKPGKAGAGARTLAVLGALVLAFAAAVIISVLADLGDGPLCSEPVQPGKSCWDVSSAGRVISLILGWPGAILGAVAALAALAFAVRGRDGRTVWSLTTAAVVLCGLSIAVAQVS